VDDLLPRVFDRVLEVLDAEAGSVWIRREDVLVCRLARGPSSEGLEGLELPMGVGIVGDVARRGEPEIVTDARSDARFVQQVDEATGFVTRSMLAAPLEARNEVLGVLQVLNRRSGDGRFDEGDLALLTGLALTAGLALRNAQLHASERKARDLRALLGISRELTSTLDVERLSMSVVNLGSQALAYDRAAVALDEGGRLVLKAVSGRESVGSDPGDRELEALIAWLSERGEVVYVADVAGAGGVAPGLRAAFPEYFARTAVRSLCLMPLRDEEGRLGALYLESAKPDLLEPGELEEVELLGHQFAVTLRNAQLYEQVPFRGIVERSASWRRRLASTPRGRLLRKVGIPALVLLGIGSIPCAERVKPRSSVLVPAARTPVRAPVEGLLAEVRVDEGQTVEAGQVLAVLRDERLRMGLEEARAGLGVAEREAASARARADQTAEQRAEIEGRELRGRVAVLEEQAARATLRAPVSGVVLTARPRDLLGEWLHAGETFVVLGRSDPLEVESRLAQADVERVRPGRPIRLRVPARPEYTFVGTVLSVAPAADSIALVDEPTFVVRSGIENDRGLLRPGMEAHAKIVGSLRPMGWFVLRPFVRWVQLRFWR
jgi:GAF domain-containing protein